MGLLDWITEKIFRVKPRSPEWCKTQLKILTEQKSALQDTLSSIKKAEPRIPESHEILVQDSGVGFEAGAISLQQQIEEINKQIQGLKRYMGSHNYPIPKDSDK